MADVSVIGAGSWGIALALVLAKNGNKVTVWSIVKEEIDMLNEKREHVDKLPGVPLPSDMVFTTDLEEAVKGKKALVLAVPSVFTRGTANKMKEYVEEKNYFNVEFTGPFTNSEKQKLYDAEIDAYVSLKSEDTKLIPCVTILDE